MKNIFLLYIILLFVVAGCGNEITDSEETQQLNFIDLPSNPALADTTKFDNYYMIHGSYGKTIQYTRQFTGGPFGQYSITATLAIDSGTIAVSDSLLCLLSVGAKNTSALVSPIEQYFAHPFKLTLKYTGLDLQGLNISDLQFIYTNEADVTINVTYDSITLDYVTGTLEVVNAIIKYDPKQVPDAKYGWVRKAD